MSKKFTWYEAYDCTSNGLRNPSKNWYLNDFCYAESELLGRYSTRTNGAIRLKKWAEQKGISFIDNIHEVIDPVTSESFLCIGVYYSIDDKQVKYTDDWAYASQAILLTKTMELDLDI